MLWSLRCGRSSISSGRGDDDGGVIEQVLVRPQLGVGVGAEEKGVGCGAVGCCCFWGGGILMATMENGKAGAEERVIAATRRPDGSLRKEIRIRAGYTPQDEVAIYQPKGAQVLTSSWEWNWLNFSIAEATFGWKHLKQMN